MQSLGQNTNLNCRTKSGEETPSTTSSLVTFDETMEKVRGIVREKGIMVSLCSGCKILDTLD